MARFFKVAFRVFAGLIVLFVFSTGFTTYDYGLTCTRCLCHEHHAQLRFCGLPLWDYTMGSRVTKYSGVYEQLFGKPCEHMMKKGGFGDGRGGCGMTAEGVLFQWRDGAMKSLYEAFNRTSDRKSAMDAYALIDKLFPENTTVESYYAKRRKGIEDNGPSTLFLLGRYLDLVETKEQWAEVYSAAEKGFVEEPAFAKDIKVSSEK